MNNIANAANTNHVLVLFSGGKDSFLATAMLVEQEYTARLLTCNNGAVQAEKNILHGVRRLQNKYGEDRVRFEGAASTAGIIQRLNTAWMYESQKAISEKYPDIVNAQLLCLHCQTAMWISAIAYAEAKNIKTIATGYHNYDEFCTGCIEYINLIREIAATRGIEIMLPVWDKSEWQNKATRDIAMIEMFFEPQVLEPKCMLGMPVNPMNENERKQLVAFFRDNIMSKMQENIDKQVPHFRVAKLSETALIAIEYPLPEKDNGCIF